MVQASRSGITGRSAKDNGDWTSLWTAMVWRRQRKASIKESSKMVNGMAKALSFIMMVANTLAIGTWAR